MDKFRVVKIEAVPTQLVADYWHAMYTAATLKYRFSDMLDPQVDEIMAFMGEMSYLQYAVMDLVENRMVAEFAMENFIGNAAMIHFSTHPRLDSKNAISLAKVVSDSIINEWKNPDGSPYLCTLYGLTPKKNRAACLFVLKAGFKKLGVIPQASKFLGAFSDTMITFKTRDTVHG